MKFFVNLGPDAVGAAQEDYTLIAWDSAGAASIHGAGVGSWTWTEKLNGLFHVDLAAGNDNAVEYWIFHTVNSIPSRMGSIPLMLQAATDYADSAGNSFANTAMKNHLMIDKLIERTMQDRLIVADIDNFIATYSEALPEGAVVTVTREKQYPDDPDNPVLRFGIIEPDGIGGNTFTNNPEGLEGGSWSGGQQNSILEVRVTLPTAGDFPAGTLTITRGGLFFPSPAPIPLLIPAIAAGTNTTFLRFHFDGRGNAFTPGIDGKVRLDTLGAASEAAIAAAVRDVSNATPAAGSLGEDVATAAAGGDPAAIADAVLDEVVEGTLTLRQMLRIFQSVLAGKSTGGGTATITFQDVADSKSRITATVDANGNRTAITVDGA